MEKQDEKSGCCSSGCHGCCWGKLAVGLFLLLIGALGGYLIGRCHGRYGMCPTGIICPFSGAASAPTK
jgi:hypothetical protein